MLLVNHNNKLLLAETSLNTPNPRRHHIPPTCDMGHRTHIHRHTGHLLQYDSAPENSDELSVSLEGDRITIDNDSLRVLHKLCLHSRLVRELLEPRTLVDVANQR